MRICVPVRRINLFLALVVQADVGLGVFLSCDEWLHLPEANVVAPFVHRS